MMKKIAAFAVISIFALGSASAGEPLVYPEKGQSAKQQAKDKQTCYSWAKEQLGYDPETLLTESQQAGEAVEQAPKQGGAVRGAAKGAAAGAVGGAIGGDVGKGAAIGAGVGGAGGAARRAKSRAGEEQAEESIHAQTQQKLDQFHKAEATCLKGKGYSVG